MIAQNIQRVFERIERAAKKSGRSRKDIKVIAVTKTVEDPSIINEVLNCGISDIGENRVQEAVKKFPKIKREGTTFHLIGRLQTNKVKRAVELFDLIQSADRQKLIEEINKRAARIQKVQDILLEVNISGEDTKAGFSEDEILQRIPDLATLRNIRIIGLMTIAPLTEDPEEVRPYFRKMKGLQEKISRLGCREVEMRFLSMGMTNDFEVAVEEGANMVRIGRAIFEETCEY
jgi:hypothetical protein